MCKLCKFEVLLEVFACPEGERALAEARSSAQSDDADSEPTPDRSVLFIIGRKSDRTTATPKESEIKDESGFCCRI